MGDPSGFPSGMPCQMYRGRSFLSFSRSTVLKWRCRGQWTFCCPCDGGRPAGEFAQDRSRTIDRARRSLRLREPLRESTTITTRKRKRRWRHRRDNWRCSTTDRVVTTSTCCRWTAFSPSSPTAPRTVLPAMPTMTSSSLRWTVGVSWSTLAVVAI